jgi:hypothetical protein
MNGGSANDMTDAAVLVFDVSDESLENAAGATREKAGAFTLAFCSGFDTCPS